MINISEDVLNWVSLITESLGVVVARVMCGSFMTSLEMAGMSLSLMRADQETLRLFGEYIQTLHTFAPPGRTHTDPNDPFLKGIVVGIATSIFFKFFFFPPRTCHFVIRETRTFYIPFTKMI